MPKRDFYRDPDAPEANSLVVAVTVVVQDADDKVLLIRRSDNGLWAAPGGAQDLGETVTAAAVREVQEETGLDVTISGVSGIYSDPAHVIAYDDGEVRQEFAICLTASVAGGTLRTSSESSQVAWVQPEELATLDMHPSMFRRIAFALESPGSIHVD
jgi:ADP-ribose pyrophosphatase YjhB (NUDIX family)